MTGIDSLTGSDIVGAIGARTLSCRQVAEASLACIAALEPHLNAFITADEQDALEQADRLDADLARGGELLPLHGVPIAIKDIIDVRGFATTCHSRIMPRDPACEDAIAVARLREAGAVIIGKTALHEFATGGPSFDLPWPPARNPWRTTHHPGGSSSGSGVAVAASMVPAAIGTDTAGSVRHPATACGVVGFKPSYDAISRDGVFPLSCSLDHVGPLARTVEDCSILYTVMAGRNRIVLKEASSLKGKTVGILDEFAAEADPEIAATYARMKELLADLGCVLVPLDAPRLDVLTDCARLILRAEAFAVHSDWLRERGDEYGQRGRRRLSAGRDTSAAQYIRAQQTRGILTAAMEDALKGVEVAISVSSLALPCAIDDAHALDKTYDRQARTPFNLTGQPALSLPAGLSSEGLPIGIQFAACAGMDEALLRFAHAFQCATSWHKQRPPLARFVTSEKEA